MHFVSRLMGRRKPLTRTAEKLAAAVDRRSLREMQNLLFKIKRDYRAAHKRYSQTHGFNALTAEKMFLVEDAQAP
jgi:hypothetical protein